MAAMCPEWGGLSEKAHFDLDEFFQFVQDAPARDEKDDVVAVLDDGFGMVSHNGFAGSGADDGGNVAAFGPFDAADAPADDGGSFLSPCATTSMASAVPRRMGWTATMSPRRMWASIEPMVMRWGETTMSILCLRANRRSLSG
ncbi:hypothetical protein BN1095_5330001 [Clostridioides difficile]|uniref:Uncharacterized protein n=1 Tax=Clostridioides difficile TaxID=1496 RepID=A0A069ASK8_CLODI|nr:hypothetical protein BN1095_5330001 [Clostridioides difficile]